MTTTSERPSPSVTAHIEERILAPLRRSALSARSRFLVLLALTLVVHAALLAMLLYHDHIEPPKVASQETPVEVIVEPPKSEPKPPKPQANREIEKPASSAPRAPTDTTVDTASLRKETNAPKTAIPPTDGRPAASKDASSPSDQMAKPEEDEVAAKPDDAQKDAEALDVAKPLPPKRPETIVKPTARAKARRAKAAVAQLSGMSPLPDYSFARPAKKSPVYGGNEDSRYLAIVYGMILAHRPRFALRGEEAAVTIDFNVNDDGSLVAMAVEKTSGDPEIDAAGISAIRRAAPFPPLPQGAPHSLVATVDFGLEAPVYTTDSRGR